MTEFKQIIGRGTRMREDYGKFFFNIIDYTGSATHQFADPSFDGFPEIEHEIEVDADGNVIAETDAAAIDETADTVVEASSSSRKTTEERESSPAEARKYYIDGGQVKISAHLVYELDADGNQLRVVQYTDYTAEKVRTLFTSAHDLKDRWADPLKREEVLLALAERGINFKTLAEASGHPEADPFDLLCHLAFNAPLRTRRERAEMMRRDKTDFFTQYGPEAQAILNALLDKYCDFGPQQFTIPDALQVPPISSYGNVMEIVTLFGGAPKLKLAIDRLQVLLYSS
jgi:type I restriction enzyme R subunit